ncbi:MAG: hypothetical protein IT369_17140 [Candidatus Latescibacteria bacterium]|nr:hypothetical protein [Candidatus Latescibacterota bacterium]
MPARWRTDNQLWVEAFVCFNFLGLALDILIAHSANHFRRSSEYIPLYFSLVAPAVLFAGFLARERWRHQQVWCDLGHLVGWAAVGIGLTGTVLHLDSQFFYERTLRSLTYAAPFAAPLAYTGLGLLLIMNRMVRPDSLEWAQWVILLTLGGFLGNFVFSLTDHAINGFYYAVEWLPVASSAFAVSFLLALLLVPVNRRFLLLCGAVLVFQGLVGVAGAVLHLLADGGGHGPGLFAKLVHGAPAMAPLLFPNLVLLGLIALWARHRHLPEAAGSPPP